MSNKLKLVSLGVLVLLGLLLLRLPVQRLSGAAPSGVTTVFTALQTTQGVFDSGNSSFTGTLQIGANGTTTSLLIASTSASILGNAPVTASTTKAFDIAVTGVVSGDMCVAQAASTSQAFLGMSIVGCSASTTAGFLTLLVSNPGATAVVPYSIASSTHFIVIR